MGLVSSLVLRSYLIGRLDAQLDLAVDRAAGQLRGVALQRVEQVLSPLGYVVAVTDRNGDRVRVVGGDPDEQPAARRLTRLRFGELRSHAEAEKPFDLKGTPDLRVAARYNQKGRIVAVAVPLSDVTDATNRLAGASVLTGVGLVGLLALAGQWLMNRGLAPLSRMITTADRVSTGADLSARLPGADRRTEVGRLATAINTMLGRIETSYAARVRSEERIRAFAADASHELRTPLTTIRGYAELFRQGAFNDEEQVREAMRRIEMESERMSKLVAELLELARLDRGTQLDLADTDLVQLVRDGVADAAAVEPERDFTVETPERLLVAADEPRIRQVLANLLANVRAHTPADTPARVRLSEDGDEVLLDVADDGPGMSEEEAARAFDRFHTASGQGSGLGLAIVSAIAAAHGGSAEIVAHEGAGTRVRIRIPRSHAEATSG
ncbi:MAG: HAMP domain-containing protein [Streptosporangiales bacterium]|nr:HAMP domain-containing protein [Streptosporangiales bacterium]